MKWLTALNNADYTSWKSGLNDFTSPGAFHEDGARLWLADRNAIAPKLTNISGAADLYGNITGGWLWALTIQRAGEEGGSLTMAMPSILTEPWNPIAGSNWIYDMTLIRGTSEMATYPDPFTGLYLPNRVERAEVVVQEGLPVFQTLDWVTLSFEPEILVPDDAWADWDAAEQTFITVGELKRSLLLRLLKPLLKRLKRVKKLKYLVPSPLTARSRSTTKKTCLMWYSGTMAAPSQSVTS
jgi:hypothetical protein